MRLRSLIVGAIAVAGVLAGATASAAATSSRAEPTTPEITCTLKLYSQTPTKLSGFSFGFIHCSKPFGTGVQSSSYTATVNSRTGAATDQGRYTNWFDDGTVSGRSA